MIVYRSQDEAILSADLFARACATFRDIEDCAAPPHPRIQALLIEVGELEAAIADALCPGFERSGDEVRALRQASICAGHLFYRSWQRLDLRGWIERLGWALARVSGMVLPRLVRASVPEGYAYYGLYPETYLESALRFVRQSQARRAVCIGIRGIGTSLSAVVAATLEESACRVQSYTIRPQGHPFNRTLSLSPRFEEEWRALGACPFLIVDEGPGMSGSTFAAVADKLSQLGVPDDRITLFPSWEADGSSFVSQAARARWQRHGKYVTNFEQVWMEDGRLRHPVSSTQLVDISAGAWRKRLYRDPARYPAAQPQHEARKYLAGGVLLKFAGLGRFGERKLSLARDLADAGFTPPALGLTDGFLVSDFVAGTPLNTADVSHMLLERMAAYLAHRQRECAAPAPPAIDSLMEMTEVNAREGLGPMRREWFRDVYLEAAARPAVKVDGRMMPHEWILTGHGILKTDALDHHSDHFFPGVADIAWDLAGACVEFQLDSHQRRYLLDRYSARSGDRVSQRLLQFYETAYLAFRLGYTAMAADAVGAGRERDRFAALRMGYAYRLEQHIHTPARSGLVPV